MIHASNRLSTLGALVSTALIGLALVSCGCRSQVVSAPDPTTPSPAAEQLGPKGQIPAGLFRHRSLTPCEPLWDLQFPKPIASSWTCPKLPELVFFETTDPVKTRQMDSLVTGQLLARTTEPALHESRYTITDVGARYAPRVCYGHRQVTSIDSSTPPAVANGFPETQVTFHYTYMDVPVWAKSAAVEAAAAASVNGVNIGGTECQKCHY